MCVLSASQQLGLRVGLREPRWPLPTFPSWAWGREKVHHPGQVDE